MALFYECMQQCARKALDSADIVRDGDLSPTIIFSWNVLRPFCLLERQRICVWTPLSR